MLCPRCQSDNKPGRHVCWNCLSPLEGALALRFAQRPPDAAGGKGGTGAKKQGQAFWFVTIGVALGLVIASMIGFGMMSSSAKSSLPVAAADYAPKDATPAPPPPAADSTPPAAAPATPKKPSAGSD